MTGQEFYGVTTDNFTSASVPNGVWLTLDERRNGLANSLIVIGSTGTGEYYVLDTAKVGPDGECPVLVWAQGRSAPSDDLEVVAADFGSFFSALVSEALVS